MSKIRWFFWPLFSRKVQVGVAALVVAWAAELGYNLSSESVLVVATLATALILAIAHEDHATKLSRGAATVNAKTPVVKETNNANM